MKSMQMCSLLLAFLEGFNEVISSNLREVGIHNLYHWAYKDRNPNVRKQT